MIFLRLLLGIVPFILWFTMAVLVTALGMIFCYLTAWFLAGLGRLMNFVQGTMRFTMQGALSIAAWIVDPSKKVPRLGEHRE